MGELDLVTQLNTETGEVQTSRSIALAQAQIQGFIVSAKNFPRNEQAAWASIVKSCKNPELAKKATYCYPRGGKQIKGASVNLAREAARLWGNIEWGLNVISDGPDERTIEGYAWDGQTNARNTGQATFKKLIQRKVDEKTQWIVPDERDLRELTNRLGAILVRNCILQLIPPHIVDEARKICAETLLGGIKDPVLELRKMVKAFEKFHITAEMIATYIDHDLEVITSEEIVDLQGVYRSIQDGNSRREDYFKAPKRTIRPDPPDEGNGETSATTITAEDIAPPQDAAESSPDDDDQDTDAESESTDDQTADASGYKYTDAEVEAGKTGRPPETVHSKATAKKKAVKKAKRAPKPGQTTSLFPGK